MTARHIVVLSLVTTLLFPVLARAGAILTTGHASAGSTGTLRCTALNVGRKPLKSVIVGLRALPGGIANTVCLDLAPGSSCERTLVGPTTRSCEIKVDGGSAKSVRGGLTLDDASGNSVLFLEAKK